MSINNQIMLITYSDSLGGDLKKLNDVLATHYQGALGGLHILPFFPSSADRGFAPTCYHQVDPAFGTWEDIDVLGQQYQLMFDFMINHISRQSTYYRDMVQNQKRSPYWDMFLHYSDFWPNGEPTAEQLDLIYKRKPRAPYIDETLADGTIEKLWCTFSEEQVDLNVDAPVTQRFIKETLRLLASHGMSTLRLDAFAYAVKKIDTNCFFVEPEIWTLLNNIQKEAAQYGVTILPEIHEHYSIQMKIANQGFWVYDFALPMLLLYTLYTGNAEPLKNWLRICPRKQFTTLDTHDGIGVVDVKDLLSDEQVEETRDLLYSKGANVSRIYSTASYNNLDIYQINCTYYSALGDQDKAYLLSRAIQFFAPGIPQVYYVGMLAGANDLELVERTRQGRDINRHGYTQEEVAKELERSVVRSLRNLMRFRNSFEAFDGELFIEETTGETLILRRQHGNAEALLQANCNTHEFTIRYRTKEDRDWQLLTI